MGLERRRRKTLVDTKNFKLWVNTNMFVPTSFSVKIGPAVFNSRKKFSSVSAGGFTYRDRD